MSIATKLALVASGILLLVGCSSDPDHIATPVGHSTTVVCVDEDGDGLGENCSEPDCDDQDPEIGACPVNTGKACTDGAERECKIKLGKHNSVQSCWMGTQTCDQGVWGDCVAGTAT